LNENLGEKALKWLTEEGFSIEPLKQEGFLSVYQAYYPSNPKNKFSVAQANGDDKIVMGTGIFLDQEDQSRIAKLPSAQRTQIVIDLSKLLYSFGDTAFKIDENRGVVKSVTVTKSIFADGLSKDRFMGAITDLYRTTGGVLLHLNEYLGWQTPEVEKAQAQPQPLMKFCTSCGKPVRADAMICSACGAKQTVS
jgi:hypothetical protein